MELVSLSTETVPTTGRRWVVWVSAAVVVSLASLGTYWGYTHSAARASTSLVGAKFQVVAPAEMQIKVNKDGELQAVNNIDIQCLVDGGSTIVQIVKEGAQVKKGDVLVVLDSSLIRQKLEDTSLDLQKADNDLTTSKELFQIQESQNAANLDAAKVDLDLAKLALKQYEEGTYPQDVATAKTTLEMAKITVANKEDDLRQTRELYAKNFVTLADVKTAELSVTTVQNDLSKAQTALTVLQNFTHQMEEAGKKNYVAQSAQKLAHTERENAANLHKAKADVDAKEAALNILKRRFARFQEQLDYCTIKAPADGLVVYAQNNSNSNAPIQEGTPVRERQTLLRLPDTSAMKAVIRANETQVTRLAVGQRATVRITGLKEPCGATLTKISPVADSSQRWWNPDLREYPVELTLDETPPNLKPGIGVQSEVLVESIPDALTVPLTALYAQGPDSFVFVRKGDGAEPRRVMVAESNDTDARVVKGLDPQESVLLLQPGQGRELLEKAGVHLSPPEQPKSHAGKTGVREARVPKDEKLVDPKLTAPKLAKDDKLNLPHGVKSASAGPIEP